MAQGGGDIFLLGQSKETDGHVAQGQHYLWGGAGPHSAAVFIQGHIPHPVDPVFDTQ